MVLIKLYLAEIDDQLTLATQSSREYLSGSLHCMFSVIFIYENKIKITIERRHSLRNSQHVVIIDVDMQNKSFHDMSVYYREFDIDIETRSGDCNKLRHFFFAVQCNAASLSLNAIRLLFMARRARN